MPLIDAYIKCDTIEGSYKATGKTGKSAKLEELHNGWSEIYSFDYSLSNTYPTITITKPVDKASNGLYIYYLQNRAREIQKIKPAESGLIDEIKIELCRWVDNNNDGIIDEFQVFLEYSFKKCRVASYGTSIDFDADDLPEESITFGFREMFMKYYRPDNPSEFTWDFTKLQQ